ncbi:LexA family protein [Streptomyces violascens]|uniref:LexA family protein n=1 Tax=Streptomyces violascens TaxID=67381 RepID=UPI00367BE4FD
MRMGHPPLPTPRQAAILRCIRETVAQHGQPPTVSEIGAAVGLSSTASVAYHLRKLEDQGILIRTNGQSRAYRIC